jgi:hypothetical protein
VATKKIMCIPKKCETFETTKLERIQEKKKTPPDI